LKTLTFFSKKELDFKDFVLVSELKLKKVLHLTFEGKKYILHICNRINNNRLTSSEKNQDKVTESEQALLDDKIKNY